MNKREVIKLVLEGGQPPYVPWSFGFTVEAKNKLQAYYAPHDLEDVLDNHLLKLGSDIGFFTGLGGDCVQDVFGVVWDRSIDKDIGNVRGCVLPRPTLKGYAFPDPLDPPTVGSPPSAPCPMARLPMCAVRLKACLPLAAAGVISLPPPMMWRAMYP